MTTRSRRQHAFHDGALHREEEVLQMAWKVTVGVVMLLALVLSQSFAAPAEAPKPAQGMLEVTYYYLPG